MPGTLAARARVIAVTMVFAQAYAPGADGNSAATPPAVAPAATTQPASAPARAERTWLEEVTVTAVREQMASFAAPYVVDTLPMGDFAHQRMYRSITQALSDVPGVMVQKTSQGQGSPYIRGFTGYHTLLLVDGVRINHSILRSGPNQYWNVVDPFVVDRLEVVKGPASVLYGSDAIGGTVNAITRSPEGIGTTGWWRQAMYRYSSANQGNSIRGEVNATMGPLGVLGGGAWREYGDVYGGHDVGVQPHTGYGECEGDMKAVYQIDRDTVLTAAHYNFYQDDAWRTHKTTSGISWHGTTVGDERKRVQDLGHSLTYARYQRRNMGGAVDSIDVTASYQQMVEREYRVRANGRYDKSGTDVDTYGLSVQLGSPMPVGRLVYGFEAYHDEVRSFRREWNANGTPRSVGVQGPVGDDADYDLAGVYCQYELPLWERAMLIIGGRYNYARADADRVADPLGGVMDVTGDWESVVGSARLSWFLDDKEKLNWFSGVSQGFRAPNLSDLTRLDEARTKELETPSPDLEPEKYVTYETGFKVKEKDFQAQVAGFYTHIQDMIVRTPTGAIINGNREVTKRNAGDGGLCGAELSARYRFHPRWTAFGDVAYTYGEVETFPTSAPISRSEPLSRLMPLTAHVGLRWDSEDAKWYVEGVCTMAAKQDKLSTADKLDTQRFPPGGTPGYATFDLRAGYRVSENMDVWAGVENITNQEYRIHGSGVNEAGTNLKVGLRWRF